MKGLDALDGVQQSIWRPQISCWGGSARCWYEVLVKDVNVNHLYLYNYRTKIYIYYIELFYNHL